jgi:hypothetical protein
MRKLEQRVVLDAAAVAVVDDVALDIQPRAGGLDIAVNQGATVAEGGQHQLSAAELSATSSQPPENVVYTITALPNHGQVLLNGNAAMSFTQLELNNGLVSYIHDGDENSMLDSFSFKVKDNLTGEANGVFEFTVDPVNDENPAIDLNGDNPGRGFIANFVENGDPISIVNSGEVTITDGDSDAVNLESVTIRLTNNADGAEEFLQVDVGDSGIVASLDYDNGEAVLTLSNTASIEAYENVMSSLVYGNHSDAPSTENRIIQVTAFDGENSSNISTILVSVEARNDAPTWSHPASQVAIEDTPTLINGITVSDVDAGTGELMVTLTVSHGSLSLPTDAGLTALQNNGSNNVVLRGTLDSLNQALAGLTYTGSTDFNGLDELQLLVDDQGSQGSGAALTASSSMVIDLSDTSVSAVNDAPVIAAPASATTLEDNAISFTDISITDVDADDGLPRVTISAENGQLSLASISGLTLISGAADGSSEVVVEGSLSDINAALNGLTFTPDENYSGQAALVVAVNDQSPVNPGPLSDEQRIEIAVTPSNDLPQLDINEPLVLATPDAPAPIGGELLAASDPDNANSDLRYTLSGVPENGELMLDGTTLQVGDSFSQEDINSGRISYAASDMSFERDQFEFALSDPATTGAPPVTATFDILMRDGSAPNPGVFTAGYESAAEPLFGNSVAAESDGLPAQAGSPLLEKLDLNRPDYLQSAAKQLQELAANADLGLTGLASTVELGSPSSDANAILRSCSEVAGLGACNLAAADAPEARLANAQPELLGRYMEAGSLSPQAVPTDDLLVAAAKCDHLNEAPAVFAEDYRSGDAGECAVASPSNPSR